MTAPPPPPGDDLPDEVTEAYRRRSALDVAHPGTHTRAAILAEAARVTHSIQRAEQSRAFGRWQWKAAASLAVVGVVGVLTSEVFRSTRNSTQPPSATPATAPVASAPLATRVSDGSHEVVMTQATNAVAKPAQQQPDRKVAGTSGLQEVITTNELAPAPAPAPTPTPTPAMTASAARAAPLSRQTPAVDAARAGQAFPVSAAVQEGCDRILREKLLGEQHCLMAKQALEKMRQERRDEPWATETEAKMRRIIEATPSGNAGHYTIRAVECRESMCAVEVASPTGPYPEPTLRRKLTEDDKVFASTPSPLYMTAMELSSSVQQVYVTVCIYTRQRN
jgi:hypothetical protein